MSDFGASPSPQDLQFEHAEPLAPEPSGPTCLACRQSVGDSYFHAQGQVVCPNCAERIQSGQQAPPALSLLRAALYGGGAALAGCTLYALVAIVLNAEIGIIAILVGWMVGKAIRHASNGMGGRPQQILAVTLTYFAISTSYIPVLIYHLAQKTSTAATRSDGNPSTAHDSQPQDRAPSSGAAPVPAGTLLFAVLTLAVGAPFFALQGGGISGLISLFIMFIGLQRAWRMTGRTDIILTGPYAAGAPQ